MKKNTFYVTDFINDDFAGTTIKRKPLKKGYKFYHDNPVFLFFAFIFYRIIVTPLVFLYQKIFWREKIIGKKKLKKCRKEGYFMYGNHTLMAGDAFTPTLAAFPKKAYILVNPDATSIPFVSSLVEMLGGMPVPDSRAQIKPFCEAIKKHAQKSHVITIYPEAHIWPLYTDIRPFKDVSFRYPAEENKPIFTFTRTYTRRRFSSKPKCTVYIDGPFFPDENLTVKENQKMLRDKAYNAMKERAKLSDYSVNEYIEVIEDKEIEELKEAV